MHFHQIALSGVYLIEPAPHVDERGFFARTYCEREFAEHGLCTTWVQCNLSHNERAGTLRGMHWQEAPHGEEKLVRCTRGAVFDVVVDMRADSPTFLRHFGVELSEENGHALYIPRGFAHGFLTLRDSTQVFYQMGGFHTPEAARGARYNDPVLNIAWPRPVAVISDRDRDYPDFSEGAE